ncbi:heterodisulfide reductase subunit B [Streptomyces achromogenes]|nr:heterodisulfide reductase subunit B [Streptomyces achromogenes]
MRIALFITCFNDMMFPRTGQAVTELLERLGHTVEFPQGQTCCGQMHFNTGYRPETLPMVSRFAEVFAGYDAVVTPSGSCAGMVRDHHRVVAAQFGDRELVGAVEQVVSTVYELSELLVDVLGLTDVGARFPHRVTYHPTCHSLRMLRVGDRPLRLLRAVKDIDLLELPDAESCCGFGGTFALKNADVSNAMLADKMRHVLDTGARVPVRGRQLLPDAHRRRPVPAAYRRRHSAPGRDPGLHGRRRTMGGADNVVWLGTPASPEAARTALADTRLRANLRRATGTIRDKRLAATAELDDWEELRETAAALKRRTLRHLDQHLLRLEETVTVAGGTVHWASNAAEANAIVTRLVQATGESEVVKVKSMATQEIGLNEALAEAGIRIVIADEWAPPCRTL